MFTPCNFVQKQGFYQHCSNKATQSAFVGRSIYASPSSKHFRTRIDTTERLTRPGIRGGKLLLKLAETVTIRQIRRKKKDE